MKYFAVLIGLVGVCCLSSCATFRYFPPRQTVYALDSAKNFRVNLDVHLPLQPFGTTGIGTCAAYALTDGFGLTAHAQHLYSGQSRDNNSGLNANYAWLNASSVASSYGGGILMFGKSNARNGFEFQAVYDFQRVDYGLSWTYGYSKHGVANLKRDLQTILLQPAHWHYVGHSKFYAACGLRFVAKSSKNNPSKTFVFGDADTNFLLEPGLGFNTGICAVGMNFCVSPLRPSRTDLWTDGYDAYYQVPVNLFFRLSFSSQALHSIRTNYEKRKTREKKPLPELFR